MFTGIDFRPDKCMAKTISKNGCISSNTCRINGLQCSHNPRKGKRFCKTHLYLEKYTQERLDAAVLCDECRMYKAPTERGMCLSCIHDTSFPIPDTYRCAFCDKPHTDENELMGSLSINGFVCERCEKYKETLDGVPLAAFKWESIRYFIR